MFFLCYFALITVSYMDFLIFQALIYVKLCFSASGVEQRLEILACFLSAGYNDLNQLNYGVVWKWVLQPLLGLI